MSSLSASETTAAIPEGGPALVDDWAVSAEGLSVSYRTTAEKKPTLKKMLTRLGRRERMVREVRALRDVSFAIRHGTVTGVIGVNGAGKSTLMRTVAGILPPTEGRVIVNGRLAFSVAVNMDPDILLIDEALSVGDARFKRKSFAKMRELCAEARTIMLVSHALQSIQALCDEVIWLHQGEIVLRDEPGAVIEEYTRFLDVGEGDEVDEDV